MHRVAIIEDGIVTNIAVFSELPEGAVLAGEARIGDVYDPVAGTFSAPASDLAALKVAKSQAVRDLRWEKETAGILVGETPIRTDEKSQAKLNGAVSLFQLDPEKTQIDSWEAVPGVFVTLSKAQVEGIGLAVGAHIQACFDRSKVLCEEIAAATDQAELAAIDITAGWPETLA